MLPRAQRVLRRFDRKLAHSRQMESNRQRHGFRIRTTSFGEALATRAPKACAVAPQSFDVEGLRLASPDRSPRSVGVLGSPENGLEKEQELKHGAYRGQEG